MDHNQTGDQAGCARWPGKRLRRVMRRQRETGATATEYALLIAMIGFVVAVGVLVFGGALYNAFNAMAAGLAGWLS